MLQINKAKLLQWTYGRLKTYTGTHRDYKWVASNWRQSLEYSDCFAYDLYIISIKTNKNVYCHTHYRQNMIYERLEYMTRIRIEQFFYGNPD